MGKSRSFSIYLLKQDFFATNALKDNHNLNREIDTTRLPPGADLFILNSKPREPWWKSYFDIVKELNQISSGALVFLPVKDRCFALAFGHVAYNLKDTSYEYDFGLRITLNSLEPTKLKSTDVLEPEVARRQRTQVPVNSDLTYFDFDRDSKILKSLTGKVKDEHEKLFKHATGASNLRISTAVSPDELPILCQKLLELYESDAFKTTFPGIQNITPVRDPNIVSQLNIKLIKAIHERVNNIHLTIPSMIDYQENFHASFSGEGKSQTYEDAFIDTYYDYLEERGKPLTELSLEDLKRHHLCLTTENGDFYKDYTILNCFIFDTTLNDGTETYHLCEGHWYKIEREYIAKLKAYLDPLCADLTLPAYNHAGEGGYNKAVAKSDPNILCLDKKNISPPGQTAVEPCDLYTVRNEDGVFYHIKISTLSSKLGHLFNQGANAIELLKINQDSVSLLKKIIKDEMVGKEATVNFTKPIDSQKFHVVFGIVTHKDKQHKSDNLPLFSRISLRARMKDLQLMGVHANFGFIQDHTQKKNSEKRSAM